MMLQDGVLIKMVRSMPEAEGHTPVPKLFLLQ